MKLWTSEHERPFSFSAPISCLIFLQVPRTRGRRGAKAEPSPAVRHSLSAAEGTGPREILPRAGPGAGPGHCHRPARVYPAHVPAPRCPPLRAALISPEPLPLLQERWQTGRAFVLLRLLGVCGGS